MNKFKAASTSKLTNQLKAIRAITLALIFVLLALVLLCVYGLIYKDNNSTFWALLGVALALSPIIVINRARIQKIKTDLKTRNHNNA